MATIKLTEVPINHNFKTRGRVVCEVTAGSVNINGSLLTFGVQGLARKYENEKTDDTSTWTMNVTEAVQGATSKSAVLFTAPLM